MKLIEISTTEHIQDFHDLPMRINEGNPSFIPHVRQEVEAVFNPKKNSFFKHGKAIRWVAYSDSGICIGRVAAFVNENRAYSEDQATGGMGFFECVNDKEVAFALFSKAQNWLEDQGMEAMDGPINFGERNKYWGLLIEGFDHPPNYGNNYHPNYYQQFFEDFGFRKYFDQYCFRFLTSTPFPEKYRQRIERLRHLDAYSYRPMLDKPLMAYADDFCAVYNEAWKTHSNFKPMTTAKARAMLKTMKPIFDKRAGWFVYHEGRAVGFLIFLPEINPMIKKINGNMNIWGKIRLLIKVKIHPPKNLWAVVFGIHPEHQRKGIEARLFYEIKTYFGAHPPYEEVFISWIGSFNPKMLHIIRGLGAKPHQTLATFRKIFDENQPFKPCPIID